MASIFKSWAFLLLCFSTVCFASGDNKTSSFPDYSFVESKKFNDCARGHSAWIYYPVKESLDQIVEYNKNNEVPINTLFIHTASITVNPDSLVLSGINVDILKTFRQTLPENIKIHALIGCGYSDGGDKVGDFSWQQQEQLAKQISELVNTNPDIDGVHFDIEPYTRSALPFYIYMKKHCSKPVGADITHWEKDEPWDLHLLRVLDQPTVMAYGLPSAPGPEYTEDVRQMIKEFSQACHSAKSCYYIGLLFGYTKAKYEYKIDTATSEKISRPHKMEQYTQCAVDAFKAVPLIQKDPYYKGVAIWGFLQVPEDVLAQKYKTKKYVYHPMHVKKECLDLLKEFD